ESADSPRRESPHAVSRTTTHRVGWVVGAGVVLVAATAVAIALRPVPVERYTQLALAPAVALAGAARAARPDAAVTHTWTVTGQHRARGRPVTLPWTVTGYGGPQHGPPPPVAVTVGGAAARDLRVTVAPPSAPDPA